MHSVKQEIGYAFNRRVVLALESCRVGSAATALTAGEQIEMVSAAQHTQLTPHTRTLNTKECSTNLAAASCSW